MSDCCAPNTNTSHPKKATCSQNGLTYPEVSYATVLHHLKTPWQHQPKMQAYYFCDDPNCDVVYFGADNTTISKQDLRTKVGVKETDDDALICYCFDISKRTAKDNSDAKTFVVEKTKNAMCSCATSNPSGKCCLKDFPK